MTTNPSPTCFSSLAGGERSNSKNGAYAKLRNAMMTSIHSKPMLFTRVPEKAGPEYDDRF